MVFSGKELFELGIPKAKVKFFIGREFSSREEILHELNKAPDQKARVFTWVDWLFERFGEVGLPMRMKGNLPVRMSRGELKRIFDNGGVMINNKKFKSADPCLEEEFPIKEFIWFPNNKKARVTWVSL